MACSAISTAIASTPPGSAMKRTLNIGLATCMLLAWATGVLAQGQKDLVAHYDFNEGSGHIVKDLSGNNPEANIQGAEFVRLKKGCALKFNGIDQLVDCGKSPDFDIADVITVVAWVRPEKNPLAGSEGFIVAKGTQDTYALTHYADGQVWWYAAGGDNACTTPLPIGEWSHVAGTFDGQALKLYLNGQLKRTKVSKSPVIPIRKDLSLVIGRPPFAGMIDDVKVYSRALTSEEIEKDYELEGDNKAEGHFSIEKGARLAGNGFSLEVGIAGGMELRLDGDSYSFESAFSYPGQPIGMNIFSETPGGETGWKPLMKKCSADEVMVTGAGRHYSLQRKIKVESDRIRIADTFANIGDSPVGIRVRNRAITPGVFKTCLLGGLAEKVVSDFGANPTIFVASGRTSVGLVAEDDISRVRYEASAGLNRTAFFINHFGLAAGQSYTLEWTIYPLGGKADYYTLVNRIRKDWQVNYTVDALWDFGELYPDRWAAEEVLAGQLRHKPLHYVVLTPFLDYPSENNLTRAEFQALAQATMKKLRTVQPDLKFLGVIEASLVGIREKMVRENEELRAFITDTKGLGDIARTFGTYPPLPAAMSRLIEAANLPWKDSFVRTPEGQIYMEIFHRTEDGKVVTALVVAPEPGNYQEKFLTEQVKFLIEEVSFDGVYFDTWGWGPDYTKWDGRSVDVDPGSGEILRKYTDTHLATAKVRVDIAQYLFARGKVMFANGGNARVRADQALPIFRLIENDIAPFKAGEKPPLNARMVQSQLGSPLMMMGAFGEASTIYQAVISYLRHGLLCTYYNTNLPEAGKGSGEYGPFRHMYPITPVALHEGWIEGKERIVTCVSGEYLWKGEQRPALYLFDSEGRTKKHAFHCEKTKAGWQVQVKLEDWREIAVIEGNQTAA